MACCARFAQLVIKRLAALPPGFATFAPSPRDATPSSSRRSCVGSVALLLPAYRASSLRPALGRRRAAPTLGPRFECRLSLAEGAASDALCDARRSLGLSGSLGHRGTGCGPRILAQASESSAPAVALLLSEPGLPARLASRAWFLRCSVRLQPLVEWSRSREAPQSIAQGSRAPRSPAPRIRSPPHARRPPLVGALEWRVRESWRTARFRRSSLTMARGW